MESYVPMLISTMAIAALVPIILLLIQARDLKQKQEERLGRLQKPKPIPPFQAVLAAGAIEAMHKFHPKCDPKMDLKAWREYVVNTADVFVETRAKMLEAMREIDPDFGDDDVLRPGTAAAIVMDPSLTPQQKKQAELRNWQQHGDVVRLTLDMVEQFMFRHGYPTMAQLGQERLEFMRNATKAHDITEKVLLFSFMKHWPTQCPVEVMQQALYRPPVTQEED